MRAPFESFLGTLEVLFSSLIVGWIFNGLLTAGVEDFHKDAFFNYWLVFDCCLMLFSGAFLYFTQVMSIEKDINQNIFTLATV